MVCQAVATHPTTKQKVWFNQAHLFHSTAYDYSRQAAANAFSEEQLPRNTYLGNGAPISKEEIAHINSVYDSCAVFFQWRENDLLLLDNMLFAHVREPYAGHRRVLAAMSDPYHSERGPL
jgi:hypothetical protein